MPTLLAEADWESILKSPGDYNGLLKIAAVVIAVIVGGCILALHYRREQVQRHKERMALIQAGIDPDRPEKSPAIDDK